MKAGCRNQLDFSMINKLCGCCPRQCDHTVKLWRANHCLNISLGCLRILLGSSWPTTQLKSTQSPQCKLCMAIKNDQLRLHIPHYEESTLEPLSIYSQNFPLTVSIPRQVPPNSSLLTFHSLPLSHLTLNPVPSGSISTNLQSTTKEYFISLSTIDP